MNDATEKLFQQLGGVGAPARPKPSAGAPPPGTGVPAQPAEKLDHWRTLLVELAYLLNASLQDVHYWEGVKAEKDTFNQLVKILDELGQMPAHDGSIRVVFRGSRIGKVSEKADYVIHFGSIEVDLPAITKMIKRVGIRIKHLEGRLLKSFEAFAAQQIGTLLLKIPDKSSRSVDMLRVALRIFSCFNAAVENGSPIVFTKDERKLGLLPISNEMNQPDLNLTLVAALNDLRPETMQELVAKTAKLRQNQNAAASGTAPVNVYQTIFQIKSLRQKLVKPPLEVNSDRPAKNSGGKVGAAGTGRGQGAGGGQAGTGSMPGGGGFLGPDPAAIKADVARIVKKAFGGSPETARRVMQSVYGKDYHKIGLQGLGQRLGLITNLLGAMHKNPKGQQVMEQVLQRIQADLDQVPAEVMNDIVLKDDEIRFWSDGREASLGKVDQDLLSVIESSRSKAAARKKSRIALNPLNEFGPRDFAAIAEDFGISAQAGEEIIKLLKSCFDSQGNFIRATFEKKVPEFARHETRVFDILWEFLKETSRRSDRLPFLNSLQVLVKETKKPIQAVKILLADFIADPADIAFPDRNAMMLTNQMLRTYNKELNVDIEITPEEVLLVKEGINPSVVNYARWRVDAEQKKFFEKILTVRKRLVETLGQPSPESQTMPIRFLLALEREVHIFLALVGGKTAYTVIRGTLNVYGNPASQVYHSNESPEHMGTLLQHLAVLIRGFGRLGKQEDLALLEEIRQRQAGFASLADDPRHQTLVRRIMGWVDAAANNISTAA